MQMVKKPVSNPAAADATAFVKTCPNGHSVFQLATHVESRFMVQIPEGDQLDDICKPSYWAHHAARVRAFSCLRCLCHRQRAIDHEEFNLSDNSGCPAQSIGLALPVNSD